MKITPVNTSLFGKDSKLIKNYFEYFSELLAERFEVQPEVFATYLGTFELFLMTRTWDGDLSSLEEKINMLLEWFASLDKSVAKAVFVKADEGCREANDSFWSMINSDPRTNNEYSFKENIDKRFETINSILEFMVAREGWLIAAYQIKKADVRKVISLNDLLSSCKSFLVKKVILLLLMRIYSIFHLISGEISRRTRVTSVLAEKLMQAMVET